MKGDDHEPGPYSFTIPAGETFFPVSISITDDDIVEGNETFILTIDDDSLPNRVMLRQQCSIMDVTIVDDDSELCFTEVLYMCTYVCGENKV